MFNTVYRRVVQKEKPPMEDTNLSRLPLRPQAVANNVLGRISDASVNAARDALRKYLEIEVENDNDANEASSLPQRAGHEREARRAVDGAETEVMTMDAQVKRRRGVEVDLRRKTAMDFNLIRYKYLKLDWKDSPWDVTFRSKKNVTRGKKKALKKKFAKNSGPYDPTPCSPKHLLGFSEEDLYANKLNASASYEVIRIEPSDVVFSKFEAKKKYSRTITLTNVSTKTAQFQASLHGGNDGIFAIQVSQPIVRRLSLAPGMGMRMKIVFEPKHLDDYCCEFVVAVDNGPRHSIVVRAKRSAPTLISNVIFNPLIKKNPSDAITVDCGVRLLGSKFNTQTVVTNIGSDAAFFIMSEMSWELSHIKGVQLRKNRLEVPQFSIEPYRFSLKNGGEVQLEIEYQPDCEGTHTENLMIACDNMTMLTLDLLGDAILFDPRAICIDAHCKDFDVDESEVYDAFRCLDFGVVRVDGFSELRCQISSKIPVDLRYRWELTKVDSAGINDLKAVSLTISPKQGVLCESCPLNFILECDMFRFPPGIYKGLLSFIVEKIPKISLTSDATILRLEELKNGLVDVTVHLIEVRVEVREIEIALEPPSIVFHKYVNESEKHEIIAKNLSPYPVELRWTLPDSKIVNHVVSPQSTVIDSLSRATFQYEITAVKVGRMTDTLRLESCLENACFHILVEGQVEYPMSLQTTFLAHNIGPQRVNDVISFDCTLLGRTFGEEWNLSGEEFSFKNSQVEAFKSENLPSLPRLQDEKTTIVPYSASSGAADGLRLTTVALTNNQASVFVDTLTLVELPDVILSATSHDMNSGDGEFYENTLTTFSVTLVNRNHLPVRFTWTNATGEDRPFVTATADPVEGQLDMFERRRIDIGVKPHRPGPIRDFHVHCQIEHSTEKLNLSISGIAKNITVEVTYNSMNGEFTFILPPATGKLIVSEDLDMKDERCCVCFIGKFDNSPVPTKSLLASFQDDVAPTEIKRSDSTVSAKTPYKNWPLVGGYYYEAEPIKNASLNKLYKSFLVKPDPSDWRTSQQLTDTLVRAFGHRALFLNIETFKEQSQVVKIKNLTPVRTSYTAEIMEFHEREDSTVETTDPERLIQPNSGLLLTLGQKTGCLKPEFCTEITLKAYGNCWGIYFDHLTVNIPELTPIIIPIVVVVSGSPVWFTFAPPPIPAVLRFTALPPNYKMSQTVYAYNNSFLPLKLSWTMYVQRQKSEEEASLLTPNESPELSICTQFHPVNAEDFMKIHIVNYLGDVDSVYYEINPRVCYIPPKGKCALTVTVNTRNLWFDLGHLVYDLIGAARAFIYEGKNENEAIDDKYSVYRPGGPDIEPLILKLETRVQLSKLHVINCVKDDFILKVTASQVFLNRSKVYKERRRYYFVNRGDGPSLVTFLTRGVVNFESAFVVGRSNDKAGGHFSDKNEIAVNSGETVELTVSLVVSEQDVCNRIGTFEASCLGSDDNAKDLIIINQRQLLEQEIPINVYIMPPQLCVSTNEINFGSLFLNRSKTQSFRLKSFQGPEVFTIRLVTDFSDVYEITPLQGSLEAKTFVNVDIRFTPKECLDYSAKLLIVPCVPTFALEVALLGRGTWDSWANRPAIET